MARVSTTNIVLVQASCPTGIYGLETRKDIKVTRINTQLKEKNE